MIASGDDMPDIIEFNWVTGMVGGPSRAIEEDVILKLNDVFDSYAPNVKRVLSSNREYDRMVKTDDGNYYAFPLHQGPWLAPLFPGPHDPQGLVGRPGTPASSNHG
jgi:putative aldouronate transport system substrate-binding protein